MRPVEVRFLLRIAISVESLRFEVDCLVAPLPQARHGKRSKHESSTFGGSPSNKTRCAVVIFTPL
jgi:hypothetical protein